MSKPDGVIIGDDTPENHKPEPEETKTNTPDQGEEKAPEKSQEADTKEDRIYAGKYKSTEDLEKAYSELEGKLGEQGNRLGQYEQEKSILLNQLQQMQIQNSNAEPEDQEQAEDLNAKLQEISNAVEEGDLSIAEGMMQTAQISSQMAQANTMQTMAQQQKQQVLQNSKSAFANENPDFFDLQQSGALEEVKAQYPGFHDDVSAFYAKKAMDTQAAMEAAVEAARNEGFEAGKAEMAKVADGDKNTRKVLQTPGEKAKDIGNKPPGNYTQTDLRSSGLAALQRARGG